MPNGIYLSNYKPGVQSMKQEILTFLETAKPTTIEEVLEAAMRRKRELYPEWEIIYMSWKKDSLCEKREVLVSALKILEREEDELRYKNTDSTL